MRRAEEYVIVRLVGAKVPLTISTGERELLRRLVAEEDSDSDDQLTLFVPGGWWLGSDQIDGKVCWRLVKHVLISRRFATAWESPSGTLYRGPYGAWKKMKAGTR